MHRQSHKAPNPWSENLNVIWGHLLTYIASSALNTPLLLFPESRSWYSHGFHQSNFRTYSSSWCWGDENSPAACAQSISWSKVICLRSFCTDTCHQNNISPVRYSLCRVLAQSQCLFWMHSILPICKCSLIWFLVLPDIDQSSWDVPP